MSESEESRPRQMIVIQRAVSSMGSDNHYPEERPVRTVPVSAFSIDQTLVTNRQFAQFVAATGYRTQAEIAPDPHDYPGLDPALAVPGSLVFTMTDGPVPLNDYAQWWRFVAGANWRHPLGPQSTIAGFEDHPVVHITPTDAAAYAVWCGKALPTEAEWEFASRGGLDCRDFAWGDELYPEGEVMANIWQGVFPWSNTPADGWTRTSPVASYPANGYGLYDMIGNVWEWTTDIFPVPLASTGERQSSCCTPAARHAAIPRNVIKGGSHLCAPSYCRRYRPAARQGQPIDTSTSHIGFRCVVRG